MADRYDVKAILFHIGEKGKTSKKAINYDSFVKTLNSPVIQERLKNGQLMGLLTHYDRAKAREAKIPHHDMVMRDPDLCNILRKVTTKDGVVYGYLDLTDTDASKRFKSLWKQGCKFGVSISTELIEKDEFYITEFFGVDFTLRPEFDTPVIEGNFSELPPNEKLEAIFSDFSVGSFEVDSSEKVIAGDFSENVTDTTVQETSGLLSPSDFSVREYLRERSRKPSVILRTRIKDVIAYMRIARPKVIEENKTFLRRYILEYINEWVSAVTSDPKLDVNLALGLRLNDYCQDRRAMRNLQMVIKRAKDQLSNGSMTRQTQTDLNKYFSQVISEIFNYVNEKVDNEDKKI